MEGILFDIQRSALHDGPGIRTTVFLKGCPLRCRWCSNPESFTKQTNLSYQQEACINCLDCVQVCSSGALSAEEGLLLVQHDRCTACGKCIQVCLQDALKLYGYKESAANIVHEVLKDKAYFDKSGGGITLSGGEPMFQYEFAGEILKQSKEAGLHTCMETCGFASQEAFEQVLPFVDLFLFDYKVTGSEPHRLLCGQSNERILDNLSFLNSRKAQILLRCPVVPGLNDGPDHYKAIAQLSDSMEGILEVEYLPYHKFGTHKYRQIGLKEAPLELLESK